MRTELSIPLSAASVHRQLGAVCPRPLPSIPIRAVVTHSAEAGPGDLFFAMRGENGSGEDHLAEAAARGALTVSAVSTQASLLVENTEAALLRLAAAYRRMLPLRHAVAITGSMGKTTVKELLAALLRQTGHAHRMHLTPGNYNNALGLSLTLLSAAADTELLIAECGMNHAGELSALSQTLRPDLAVITAVGTAHVGHFGSRELLARAKCEITDGMTGGGVLVPAEESLLIALPRRETFSIEEQQADCYLQIVKSDLGGSELILHLPGEPSPAPVRCPLFGRGTLHCLAAALAAARHLGVSGAALRESCATLNRDLTRQRLRSAGAITLLDDSYNASPESVVDALHTLTLYPGRHCALLGDMLELGSETEAQHRHIGEVAARLGVEELYLFGVYAPFTAAGARKAGMTVSHLHVNTDTECIAVTAEQIHHHSMPGDILLAKASHAVQLSRIFPLLEDSAQEDTTQEEDPLC